MGRLSTAVSITCIALAVAIWLGSPLVADRLTTPLRTTFPVVTGYSATRSFTPLLSKRHHVMVDLERNLPFARLEQIVGPVMGRPTSRPKIICRLESAGTTLSLEPGRIQYWGETVGYELGFFEASRSKRYTLTATIQYAEPDLRTLNGRLTVEVDSMTSKKYFWHVREARFFGSMVGFIGLFIAVGRLALIARLPGSAPKVVTEAASGRNASRVIVVSFLLLWVVVAAVFTRWSGGPSWWFPLALLAPLTSSAVSLSLHPTDAIVWGEALGGAAITLIGAWTFCRAWRTRSIPLAACFAACILALVVLGWVLMIGLRDL